jgi:hypothetical protein
VALCSLLLAGPAWADDAAAPGTALLRVAHLSPDSPAVDVALTPAGAGGPLTDPGPDLVDGLAYGDVTTFRGLAPGSYAVSVRAAGSSPAEPPALSVRVEVPAGAARTVAISGPFAELSLESLPDDLTPPPQGSARVRVLTAAAGVPAVDVSMAAGAPLATGLAFGGAAGPVTVPSGPGTVLVDGGPGIRAELPTVFAPGSVVTLLVLDADGGGLTVRVVLDAAGPARTPAGAVEAGSGGSASGWPGWALTGASLGVLGASGRRGRALLVLTATAAGLATASVPAPRAALQPEVRPVALVAAHATPAPAPVRLRLPSVGIDTALAGAGLDAAGALVPPADGAVAGWYQDGPAPGDVGPAVVTGHVDGRGGPAVFYPLRDVVPGEPVFVERADGSTVRFIVTAVARYPKDAFPTASVYGPTPGAELRLITCGGTFDRSRGSYRDNVVVSARLVG